MKTVLITGGSKGIGAAIARTFSLSGYNVVINYNSSEKLALDLCKEIGCTAIKADVSNSLQVNNMVSEVVQKFGGISVLVNNAGIALKQGVLQDVTEEQFDSICAVNLKGVFNATKAVIPHMIQKKSGRIINISSVWGIVGGSCESVYSMTKAGIIGFGKAMAKELAPSGITVNTVAPGFIDTDMNSHLSKQDINAFAENISLGRIGTPQEVANAVLFLASENSAYITGQVLGVDGGII